MAEFSNILRVGIYLDGGYLQAISNYYYYETSRHTRIRVAGIQEYCRAYLSREYGRPPSQIAITEAHWYKVRMDKGRDKDRGRLRGVASNDSEQIQKERAFENHLIRLGYRIHYIGPYQAEAYTCATHLAMDCYDHAQLRRFDVCFLLVYRIEMLPLLNRLVALGIPVYVLVWNISSASFSLHNSLALVPQVDAHFLPMNDIVDGADSDEMTPMVDGLFLSSEYGDHSDTPTQNFVLAG